jgi:hypothetical protein
VINRPVGSAPDFTPACIVMFGVNLAWGFMVVWVTWGLIAVAALGWVLNQWMIWLDMRRAREAARYS